MIIAGLGNPGEKYKNTRHNIGFRIVDEFAEKNNFPEFKFSKKYNALMSEELFGEKKVIAVKPQTFMNNSGIAIKKIVGNENLKPENLLLIHDDIDLPLGKIKISKSRGTAGHKGVESVAKEMKTSDFLRLRIGILPKTGKPGNVENFVIKKFQKEEEKTAKEVIEKSVKAVEIIISQGSEMAMNEYNR